MKLGVGEGLEWLEGYRGLVVTWLTVTLILVAPRWRTTVRCCGANAVVPAALKLTITKSKRESSMVMVTVLLRVQ